VRALAQATLLTPVTLVAVDALVRTRELLDRGDPIEEVVRELRVEGFSMIESMSALIKAGAVSFADANTAIIESPVWADRRDRVTTNRWVDPPARPDQGAVERLRAACSEDPRIRELWVTGSQMTRHNGSSEVSTAIAIVLDPPATDFLDEKEMAATVEIITLLDAAWPTTGRRSYLWVSREILADEEKHCLALYSRP
jgi:hypothetical protein